MSAAAVSPQSAGPATAAAELNHIYVTLRQDTIDAIARSFFVTERFAMFEQNTVRTADSVWKGAYLIGWRGYLELFAPGGAEGLVAGSSGVGFSTVLVGGGSAVRSKLGAIDGETLSAEIMHRVDGDVNVPWFENIRLCSLDRPFFSAWLMDFRPEYMARRGIPLGEGGRFDRHGYNAASYRRAGRMAEYEARVLDDLVEIHLELDAEEGASFGRFLGALGFVAAGEAGARVFRAADSVIFLRIVPAPVYRIRRVVCSLLGPVDPPVECVFGPDAKFSAQGRTAVWTFGEDGPDR
ncbi:MAG: hypothetical protein FJY82_10860 [Candidatus Aminicenantes bacterium]|nr:hypothetical protein [Candidatus Aminicenantes bacterium]